MRSAVFLRAAVHTACGIRSMASATQTRAVATAPALYGCAEADVGTAAVTASTCATPSSDWLAQLPRGAYTTARTVNRTSVLELSFHIERLAETARLMRDSAAQSDVPDALLSSDALRPVVLSTLRAAVAQFEAANPGHAAELKLTLLSHADAGRPVIVAHVGPLPGRPPPPVKIQVKGQPRSNAAAKDSEWVRERAALEADKPSDVNEIVLVTADGHLMEGMTSNFMAVMNGTLYTAGEGVLLGTIRDIVLRVCEANGIPVVLQPPRLADIEQWQGCMVSSTSRLALPVNSVEVVADSTSVPRRHEYAPDELVTRIDKLVMDAIAAASEPL